MAVFYVTAIAIPRGFTGDLDKHRRTDMGKFYERAGAEEHAAKLSEQRAAYYAVRVEVRDEA